jgi:hypothetical protein
MATRENILHLFTSCRYSLTVWDTLRLGRAACAPRGDQTTFTSMDEWWMSVGSLPGYPSKGWHSLLVVVCWELCKEHNVRVFRHKFL